MDGKLARQLLFKKKLQEENRLAEERLRARLETDRAEKELRGKIQEQCNLEADKSVCETKLAHLKSKQKSLKKDEAIQRMADIKIHNNDTELGIKIKEMSKQLRLEEQKIKEEEEDFIRAHSSVKLERKIYHESKIDVNSGAKENIDKGSSDVSKSNKLKRRFRKESEERKILLWERAQILKKKRADKMKEQLDELKKKNLKRKYELENEILTLEEILGQEKLKHRVKMDLIGKSLQAVDYEINKTVSAMNSLDLKIQQIKEYVKCKQAEVMVRAY